MEQWKDDFTSYGTDAGRFARLLDGAYAETGGDFDLAADPDPSAGGVFCLRLGANLATSRLRKVLSGPQTTVGIAARHWMTALPAGSGTNPVFASFRDVNNNQHVWCKCDPSGNLQFYRTDNGGDVLIAQSASPVLLTNTWRHLEVKVVFDVAAGSVEARLEGSAVINVAGIRTTSNIVGVAATCSQVAFTCNGSGLSLYLKDLIMWDGSGAVNNNFYGSCQVYKIIPDGDVALGWTPSAGATGFNRINETTPDDDGGYISAPLPLPGPSTFSLSDLPANVTSVKSVSIIHRSRKTDGGDGNVQASAISSGVTGAGVNRPITTAYTYWRDTYDLDPNGAVNWTLARVNALQLKLDRTV